MILIAEEKLLCETDGEITVDISGKEYVVDILTLKKILREKCVLMPRYYESRIFISKDECTHHITLLYICPDNLENILKKYANKKYKK